MTAPDIAAVAREMSDIEIEDAFIDRLVASGAEWHWACLQMFTARMRGEIDYSARAHLTQEQ